MFFKTTKAALCALVLASSSAIGCSFSAGDVASAAIDEILPGDDGAGAGPSAERAVAHDFCSSAMRNVRLRAGWSECDRALVEDCADVMEMVSPSYLQALEACTSTGAFPAECVLEATVALEPTTAQRELAHDYCNECLFGVSGCEDVFYFGDEDKYGLGMILLPFSDRLVEQVADECTGDLTCSVELPSCAQDILVHHLAPEKTVRCLLDPLSN